MKSKWIVMPIFAALCTFVACSKKDSPADPNPNPGGPGIDSSKCLLSEVKYDNLPMNAPYFVDNISFTYDSLKRITSRNVIHGYLLYSYEPGKVTTRGYINSIADSNLTNRIVYSLDNNGRIVSHINYTYFRPKSEADIYGRIRMAYEYNTEGYLTGLKEYDVYTTDEILSQDFKFTYQNGNMVQKEVAHYDKNFANNVKKGTDTISYTYDNTTWFPEAAYLYEINDYRPFKTDKANKNNVTSIQLKLYDQTGGNLNLYKTIQYVYSVKGPKLEKATMTATTTKGITINSTIGFGYKCD